MLVEVVCDLPQGLERASLQLAPGSTVRDALRASSFSERLAQREPLRVGIWGRPVSPDTELRDRDRVEIYRRLIADPKEIRRVRAAKAVK